MDVIKLTDEQKTQLSAWAAVLAQEAEKHQSNEAKMALLTKAGMLHMLITNEGRTPKVRREQILQPW